MDTGFIEFIALITKEKQERTKYIIAGVQSCIL